MLDIVLMLAQADPTGLAYWLDRYGFPGAVLFLVVVVARFLITWARPHADSLVASHLKHVHELGEYTAAIKVNTSGINDTLRVMQDCQKKQAECLEKISQGQSCRHPKIGGG